jgi:hypothetical protein
LFPNAWTWDLKQLEFIQDEDFRVILWRSEQNKGQDKPDSDYDGIYDEKILAFALIPERRTEIMLLFYLL